MVEQASFSGISDRRRVIHGALLVDANGHRWRAFAPGLRIWLWIGFLIRRVVIGTLPGRLLPFIGWSPAPRVDLRVGMPPKRVRVRVERIEPSPGHRVTRARFRRWASRTAK